MINKDTGFKIQHCFAVPFERKFNGIAAKGGKFHSIIKSEKIPFAVVLPKEFSTIEIFGINDFDGIFPEYSGEYLKCKLSGEAEKRYHHINEIIKLLFKRTDVIGNEGHVITNSKFPDVFDIIYDDSSDEAFKQYDYLIDATKTGDFAAVNRDKGYRILDSSDLEKLEDTLNKLIIETMPCYVDDLCWLVSEGENDVQYFSIFNNEGNERSIQKGNVIDKKADKMVKVTFKKSANIEIIAQVTTQVEIERVDEFNYNIFVPATSFAVLKF